MPEVKDTPGFPACKPGPVDHIGLPFQYGRNESRIFLRVVLEVGVLDENDLPRRLCDPGTQGRAFSLVSIVVEDPDAVPPLDFLLQDCSRTVC
jgi:hypothetical protein